MVVDFALDISGKYVPEQEQPVDTISLREVNLFRRSKSFPPLSAVSGIICFFKAVTKEIRHLRWNYITCDNLTWAKRNAQKLRRSRVAP